VSEEARRNGWRGFANIGERVEGGYLYVCDGMPRLMGCGAEVVISRRWCRVGTKKSGWLVCYGIDTLDGTGGDDGKGNDLDVVLTFCPTCAAVVQEQAR
jgi:hypothetical protein